MSVRSNGRRKNKNSSHGLEVAAAALSVGVGAALYYFIRKKPENPATGESTSGNWSSEQPQPLNIDSPDTSEYTTLSEHTTTDTSIWTTDNDSDFSPKMEQERKNRGKNLVRTMVTRWQDDSNLTESNDEDSIITQDDSENNEVINLNSSQEFLSCDGSDSEFDSEEDSDDNENEDIASISTDDNNNSEIRSEDSIEEEEQSDEGPRIPQEEEQENSDSEYEDIDLNIDYLTPNYYRMDWSDVETASESESELNNEWDITTSSIDVPTSPNPPPIFTLMSEWEEIHRRIANMVRNNKPIVEKQKRKRSLSGKVFRERRVSLEECAICFEVMLQDQPLMQLPCTHNFHVACIGPWLQERQTCPVCRKAAE